jgi:hypothetical protein
MADTQTIAALSDCYEAECRSLIRHVAESQPFITWLSVPDQAEVRQIAADEAGHERQLVDLILSLDGFLPPANRGTDAAGLHYLDLRYLLPRIIADKRRLIAAYEAAAPHVAANKQAATIVGRILEDERRHLAELERIERSRAPAHST